jgi:hypothetical protein
LNVVDPTGFDLPIRLGPVLPQKLSDRSRMTE